MQHHISFTKRLIAVCIAAVFLIGTVCIAGTATAEAASKWKVSPSGKTLYIGSKAKFKSNKKVKWYVSGKSSVVKIVSKSSKSVTIKGKKAGTVYLKAKYGRKVKKMKVKVRSKVPSKIKLESDLDVIAIGDHTRVNVASVSPSYASKSVKGYKSSNEAIVKVTNSGYVTGIKAGTATVSAVSKVDGKKKAGGVKITVVNKESGTVKLTVDMTDASKYPAGKVARVWIPVPQSDNDQQVTKLEWTAKNCSEDKSGYKSISGGNKALYVEWGEDVQPEDRKVIFAFHVERRAIARPDNMASLEKGTVDTDKMAEYLKQTERSGDLTSGIVKDTADKIVKDANAKTVYQKAYAIYDWTAENLKRDGSTPGIGAGDVEYILNNYKDQAIGKCTDVNAVFVALCKAEGIPARTVYGYKLDAMKSGSQHVQKCKPQYYLPGYGWAEADVSALLKEDGVMGHEDDYRGANAKYAAEWKKLKDQYWGSANEMWMMVSSGSDIELTPRQSATSALDPVMNLDGSTVKYNGLLNDDGTLNYFIYPYAEYGGEYIACYNRSDIPQKLSYTFSFTEDEEDCGC